MTGISGNLAGRDYRIERRFGWRWRDWISLLETLWVEKFWSTDLSGIALKGCMDNFTQYTRRNLVSTYCFFPVHLRERSITQHTNSKQQSLCHERYRSSQYMYKGFSLSFVRRYSDQNPPTMSEVRDTPITSNRGGTNSPTRYSPDEDLQYAVKTSWSIPKWLSCFKR